MHPDESDAAIAPRTHGGLIDRELSELGLSPEDIVDFSVNVNPYGPCPAVLSAIRAAPLSRYPDPTARRAREALGRALRLDAGALVIGNGAADLLWTLARLLVHPGSTALVMEPTFSEFRAAVRTAHGRVVEWRASERDGFAVDLGTVERLLSLEDARAVYLCAPNNPTGVATGASDIAALAEAKPRVTFVLDQAYLSLSERFTDEGTMMPNNVVCVRSLTKDHALPGVRVAYLIASPEMAEQIEASRPPWTTSALSEAALVAALGERGFVDESRAKLLADRERLVRALVGIGLDPLPSTTTFFLLKVPNSARLRSLLLSRHRILLRDCTSFGLEGFVRIAARPLPDAERLVAALAQELPRCSPAPS
jgi:histidinol-phosphate/aromatic aminotransferase/cobyric acid decarboxylase-like protein